MVYAYTSVYSLSRLMRKSSQVQVYIAFYTLSVLRLYSLSLTSTLSQSYFYTLSVLLLHSLFESLSLSDTSTISLWLSQSYFSTSILSSLSPASILSQSYFYTLLFLLLHSLILTSTLWVSLTSTLVYPEITEPILTVCYSRLPGSGVVWANSYVLANSPAPRLRLRSNPHIGLFSSKMDTKTSSGRLWALRRLQVGPNNVYDLSFIEIYQK